jgi:hypothetical protein
MPSLWLSATGNRQELLRDHSDMAVAVAAAGAAGSGGAMARTTSDALAVLAAMAGVGGGAAGGPAADASVRPSAARGADGSVRGPAPGEAGEAAAGQLFYRTTWHGREGSGAALNELAPSALPGSGAMARAGAGRGDASLRGAGSGAAAAMQAGQGYVQAVQDGSVRVSRSGGTAIAVSGVRPAVVAAEPGGVGVTPSTRPLVRAISTQVASAVRRWRGRCAGNGFCI